MVKIYKTQSEIETDIKNGVLVIQGDVKFECSISINASIKVISGNIDAKDIRALDIDALNINAEDINAKDIRALDINAYNINARNIDAYNINAWDINAWNIDAKDINAEDINALDIDVEDINAEDIRALDIDAKDIRALDINADNIVYNAFCSIYNSIKCLSIKASREVHSEPVCLEGKVEIKKLEDKLLKNIEEIK